MKRLLAALLLCALPLAAGVIIKNPYTTDGNWYIGQLHFHTNNSDGAGTPAEMKAAYAAAGYHFVVTTDHVGPDYDDDADGCTPDPGGAGPLWILGEEETLVDRHMNCLGNPTRIQTPWSAPQTIQQDIDACRALNGLAMANHPLSSATWEWWVELNPSKRLSLIEVLNGYSILTAGASDWPHGIDLADEYRQIWFTGTDDAHATNQIDKWCVVVQTASGSIAEADLLSSLDSGNFYIRQTATGPTITSVAVAGSTITLTLPSSSYTVNWYKKGKRLAETDSSVTTTASYTATGTEGYVFAEIYDGTKYAYTQPLFVINDTDLSNAAAASEGTAANLIDGNMGTTCDWTAATGNFTIDLGAAKQANGIRIYWNVSGTERWNYKIEESTTGAFAGEETEQVRTTFSNRASTTLDVFDCWTRYLKVTITGASVGAENVSVKEVEVFNASPEISEYYIDNVAGNDANTGISTAVPFLTSVNALLVLKPRDRLNFINTGTAYVAIANNNFYLDQPTGKHLGAPIYLHGLNWAEITAAGGSAIALSNNPNYFDVSGFNIHTCAKGIYNEASSYNKIWGNKIAASAGGYGVYFPNGSVGNGNIVAYNLITSGQALIFCGEPSGAVTLYIYNNTANGTDGGIGASMDANLSAVIKNNICANLNSEDTTWGYAFAGNPSADSNNCAFNYPASAGGYYGTWAKTNNVDDVDPQFVNEAAGDFRLKATSPLLRKGVAISGLTTDVVGNSVPAYTGKAPDIGAYENRPGGVFIF